MLYRQGDVAQQRSTQRLWSLRIIVNYKEAESVQDFQLSIFHSSENNSLHNILPHELWTVGL
jgi:hypothetical protein